MNSLGACVRGPECDGPESHNMDDGAAKKSEKMDKNEKSDKTEKGPPSLSIDRAAFLILRVKKAFKKKRQQRKERQ